MKTYTESQKFSKTVFYILIPICVLVCGGAGWQLITGRPVGNHPAPDAVNLGFSALILLITAAFYFTRLNTSINDSGIKYNFSALISYGDHISWADISQIEIMQFPYLGEGVRWWFTQNATAYVTNGGGNMGIMIYRKNGGRNIFISTKQIDQLREFLKSNAPKEVEIIG